MNSSLAVIEAVRHTRSQETSRTHKRDLGQFFTPGPVASFMASLFPMSGRICLLDPGAGLASLSAAFIEKAKAKGAQSVHLDCYELDSTVLDSLQENLCLIESGNSQAGFSVSSTLIAKDFVTTNGIYLAQGGTPLYTHAILNPPYKKISTSSDHRKILRLADIETVNLYAAFLWLTIKLVKPGGSIVAIIPRSFCNGPYYKPFRNYLLEKTQIKQIHIFKARNKAFKDDNVLQENVILHIQKQEPNSQESVIVSASNGHDFSDYQELQCAYEGIVSPNDADSFIHIPEGEDAISLESQLKASDSLKGLGISLSTGPVVDFRLKEHLRELPGSDCVPLLYPTHFQKHAVTWPKESKKPNGLVLCPETQKWLYPNGYYTVVKRFSSKEERKRVVANVVDPSMFKADFLGLENHLNVFHQSKTGIEKNVAYGLAAYLNSSMVDTYFRQFSGHTQVNASDLRSLPYPPLSALRELGQAAENIDFNDQALLDNLVATIL